MSAIGLDLNGLCDRRAAVAERGTPGAVIDGPVRPPVVVVGRAEAERPLAGLAAAEAIAGRGWAWPDEARQGQAQEEATRFQVMSLLAAVGCGGADTIPTRYGSRRLDRLLAAHLHTLLRPAPAPGAVCVAVADDWSDDARQIVLDSARAAVSTAWERSAPEVRLLWRPVAALFAWGASVASADLAALHGRKALVINLLPDRCMASVLDLEVDTTTPVGPLLTPVRSRAGARAETNKIWIGDIVDELATTGARPWQDDATIAHQLRHGTGAAWRTLFAPDDDPLLVQGSDGRWVLIEDGLSAPPADAAGDLVETVMAVVRQALKDTAPPPAIALVEGPLAEVRIGGKILADLIAQRLRRDGTAVWMCPAGAVALGCADHALRLAEELPTYYDVLPQLAILATRECRPTFIDLIPGVTRIAGGERYRGTVKDTFSLAPFSSALNFYLHKANEAHVRISTTAIATPPDHAVPLTLHVTQEPGQGRAEVEIVPTPTTVFPGGSVLLDWSAEVMKDTDKKTRAQILADEGSGGEPYPGLLPESAHVMLWKSNNIGMLIENFLNIDPASHHHYGEALHALLKVFGKRAAPDGDGTKYRAVPSDGKLPKEIDRSFSKLFQDLRDKIDADFRHMPVGSVEHRRLYLLGAWCYAAAPPAVIQWLTDQLHRHQTGAERWPVEAIGRSLSAPDAFSAFFDTVTARMEDDRSFGQPTPLQWIKAAAQILMFRKDSCLYMTEHHANNFIETSISTIDFYIKNGNYQIKYYWSIALLLYSLRYRRRDCGFCRPGGTDYVNIKKRLEATIGGRTNVKAADLIRQTLDYIAFNGNPALPRAISAHLD